MTKCTLDLLPPDQRLPCAFGVDEAIDGSDGRMLTRLSN